MNRRRILGAAAGTFLAVGAAGVIAMPTASATPGSCSDGGTGRSSTWALCSSGTGSYYAHVQCADQVHGYSGWYNGATVSVGSKSSVTCPAQGGVQWTVISVFSYEA
jgi:hypothetical protein